MYIIEVANTVGNDNYWFEGKGWYWMDQYTEMHGPCITEQRAIEHYAWHWKNYIDELKNKETMQ